MSDDVQGLVVKQNEDTPQTKKYFICKLFVRVVRVVRRMPGVVVALVLGVGLGMCVAPVVRQPPSTTSSKTTHETPTHAGHTPHDGVASLWTCSMHPQVQSHQPGSCPICSMDLVPVASESSSEGMFFEDAAQGSIRLSLRAQHLAQIRTEEVKVRFIPGQTNRLLGRVVEDEDAQHVISAWVGGRIDTLWVSTTGAKVRRGQVLAKVYSPQVYTAHQDLLVAKKQVVLLKDASAHALASAVSQLESARQRLSLLGFKKAELARMESAKSPWTHTTIRSTTSGTVLQKMVRQGDYMKQGQALFKVGSLDSVWVELDAYESDLARIKLGQKVDLHVDAFPNTPRHGTVSFIDPVLDPNTRTTTLRVEVDNKDGVLKPGMHVGATMQQDVVRPGEPLPLVIPHTAPLFSGRTALVYVEQSADKKGRIYKGKVVELGPRVGDVYLVRSGLRRGDRVVSHGAFVIDSDLQIRGGLSLLSRPDDMDQGSMAPSLKLSLEDRHALSEVLAGYLDIQEHLANSALEPALSRALRWQKAIHTLKLPASSSRELHDAWRPIQTLMLAELRALVVAKDLQRARDAFRFLTVAMDRFLTQLGNPTNKPVRKAHCPMAYNDRGADWFQRADTIDNVYFGDEMRQCGSITATLKQGERLKAVQTQGGRVGDVH